ncbi:glycosyltransferase [bacterium]|nr:glycosyltransferase [bacterium]
MALPHFPKLRQPQKVVQLLHPAPSTLPALAHRPTSGKQLPQPTGCLATMAAYYAPWQKSGLNSLKAHADSLTDLYPVWLHLEADGLRLNTEDFRFDLNPHTLEVLNIASQHRIRVEPVLNNAVGSGFDPLRVHRLLSNPQDQDRLIADILHFLRSHHLQGVQVDFENLDPVDWKHYPAFLRRLAQALGPAGFSLSIALEASILERPDVDWATLNQSCQAIVLMAYDRHAAEDPPGPIAPVEWCQQVLQKALTRFPAQRLVLGIGNYGYDWVTSEAVDSPRAEVLNYFTALGVLHGQARDLTFDPASLNSHLAYQDDQRRTHQIWLLDAISAANQWRLAQPLGVKGAALWVMGAEDPSIWKFLHRKRLPQPPQASALEKIDPSFGVEFVGQGEILNVESAPGPGQRRITTDPVSGLIVSCEYEQLPSTYQIRRSGHLDKAVALTFDDGPSAEYTGAVLDVLSSQHVNATFFVLGQNALRYPELLQRMDQEGHEIGSHSFSHPNLGALADPRVELELNLTQRVLQSLCGRSTLLFRPPYNADAEPTSPEEVHPLVVASKLGYHTVGELLDPEDWRLLEPTGAGQTRPRTASDIARAAIQEVETKPGNCLLLHDAGGDRSATVEALKILIPELQRRGYRFVTVSQLLGSHRDRVMPATAGESRLRLQANWLFYWGLSWGQRILGWLFLAAIFLGVSRSLLIAWLACRAHRFPTVVGHGQPPLTVLVAAYNEETVIARTIESLLASDYPGLSVVVVDDGSLDATAEVVEQRFGSDSRVRLVRQSNGGKARALNTALAQVDTPVVLCVDADTLLDRQAIQRLARHFDDPSVGAVAGNVKVGNCGNLFTIWQSIEYTASQNLDRQAYEALNAVPVVPGAIGAWRTQAVRDIGGYSSDTLAEDMDLTMRLRLAGYRVVNEPAARAYTEAPDSLPTLFRQRFRWAYGNLQCLWKHRGALGRHGYFGRLVLPSLWLFQIFSQLLSPLVDLQILWALGWAAFSLQGAASAATDWQPAGQALQHLSSVGSLYLLFFGVEFSSAWLAFGMEREPRRPLFWMFTQRIVYRQLMYLVVIKSLTQALSGISSGWNKLERKGTVHQPS